MCASSQIGTFSKHIHRIEKGLKPLSFKPFSFGRSVGIRTEGTAVLRTLFPRPWIEMQEASGSSTISYKKESSPFGELSFLVGVSVFEPEASWTRTKRDTKLRHTPIAILLYGETEVVSRRILASNRLNQALQRQFHPHGNQFCRRWYSDCPYRPGRLPWIRTGA